jgi:glycosyltransferase involved in cell wall biosynthesis
MPEAKISVLVPTYNPVPEHLQEAMECLKRQTVREWNVIIHDDASTVDVHTIVTPYLNDPRFSFRRSEKRLGIGGNWNACLKFAAAPVVQFLFQDDLWEPTYLEKGLRVLEEHPSVGFVSIDHDYRYEDGRNTAEYYEALNSFKDTNLLEGSHRGEEMLHWWLRNDLRPGIVGEPSFVMIRHSLVEKAGPFLTDMPQSLDNEYWIRCLRLSNWYYLKESLGAFRVHAASASATNDALGAGLADRLRIFQRLLSELPRGSMLRREAEQSVKRALSRMIRRYLERRTEGKSTAMRGGGKKAILRFALTHPWLTMVSIGRRPGPITRTS